MRWLAKGDAAGQAHFIAALFGIAGYSRVVQRPGHSTTGPAVRLHNRSLLTTNRGSKVRNGTCLALYFGYNEIVINRVSVADAKNRLPELIKTVENGERVTICRRGQPVAELVRASRKRTTSGIEFGGLSRLEIELDPDWWKPMSKEEAEAFLGGRPVRHPHAKLSQLARANLAFDDQAYVVYELA